MHTDPTVDLVSSAAVAAAANVHPMLVHRWTRDGFLIPTRGGGTGFPYLYDRGEVGVARVLARWRAVVNDPDTMATLARAARWQRGEDDRSIVAAVIADAVVITFGADEW